MIQVISRTPRCWATLRQPGQGTWVAGDGPGRRPRDTITPPRGRPVFQASPRSIRRRRGAADEPAEHARRGDGPLASRLDCASNRRALAGGAVGCLFRLVDSPRHLAGQANAARRAGEGRFPPLDHLRVARRAAVGQGCRAVRDTASGGPTLCCRELEAAALQHRSASLPAAGRMVALGDDRRRRRDPPAREGGRVRCSTNARYGRAFQLPRHQPGGARSHDRDRRAESGRRLGQSDGGLAAGVERAQARRRRRLRGRQEHRGDARQGRLPQPADRTHPVRPDDCRLSGRSRS